MQNIFSIKDILLKITIFNIFFFNNIKSFTIFPGFNLKSFKLPYTFIILNIYNL